MRMHHHQREALVACRSVHNNRLGQLSTSGLGLHLVFATVSDRVHDLRLLRGLHMAMRQGTTRAPTA